MKSNDKRIEVAAYSDYVHTYLENPITTGFRQSLFISVPVDDEVNK